MGGSGQGAVPQPSLHKTTPKGLRQAYAKAAGLYTGSADSDKCNGLFLLLVSTLSGSSTRRGSGAYEAHCRRPEVQTADQG